MSLSSEMSTVVHSLASASSARRQALDCIRDDTGRHLAAARASRRRTAAAQLALRSEALRSTRLAAAMVLGAANKMIGEVHRQRVARTAELKRTLADSAKRRRVLTRKWLNLESAVQRKSAVTNRRERLVYQTALRNDVATIGKYHRAFLASLTKDRSATAGIWHSHAVGGLAAASVQREGAQAQAAKREAEAMAKREAEATVKREAEAKAKHEADAMAKRETEAMVKREAEAKVKREADAMAKREAAPSLGSGHKGAA